MHPFNTDYDRAVYATPGCDIPSANNVGVVGVAATGADELGLRLPVRLVYTSAFGTGPARVARVDEHESNASQARLVFDERSQLKEGPSVQVRPLSLSHRYPLANVLEVFKRNTATGVLGLADQNLTDDVVRVGVEPPLTTTEFSEMALCTLGASVLEGSAQLADAGPYGQRHLARVHLGIGVDGEVADSEVDPEPAFGIDRRAVGDFDRHEEVELAAAVDEIGLPTDALEARSVVSANDDGHRQAAIQREQGKPVEPVLERVQPLVERYGAELLEAWEPGAVALVDFADLGDRSHGVLGRQAEAIADLAVVELLEPQLVGRLELEGAFSQPRARLVDSPHRGQQPRAFVGRDDEFDRGDELHSHRCSASKKDRKPKGCFLPALKDGASAAAKALGGFR